ncbi:MAG: TolC family protein [Acidobacteriota bacterium]|nr:TolC family protein [Acidobacteriota bacterium]
MKFKILAIPIIILFYFSIVSHCTGEEILSLSLEDCIVKAMENNLKVAVEVYNPEMADVSVTQAKGLFMPRFDIGYSNRQNENPSYWWIQGAGTVESKYSNYSIALVQQIPTGGNFSLSMVSYKSETNEGFQLINPRYGSTIQFDFTQPLLKNFGYKISRKEIIIAQNNLDISRNQFKLILQDTIYKVQEAYWNLAYTIEDYKVKQQSLQLAKDLLAKNRKEVEVGKLAPIEILNAESVVAQREADILAAEALIRRSEDILKNILNLPEEEVTIKKIVLLDEPYFVKKKISLDNALKQAIINRPDLKVNQTNVESKNLDLNVAKNQMLPGLDLNFSYWSPGISGDRIIYEGDNPFYGTVIGKEQGSANDSVRDAFKFLYKNWTVGVTLSVPLSNVLTRAEYVRARMGLEQSLLELKNSEKQILLEVRDAVRQIDTNAKRVEAYGLARELAEKRMIAEEKKLSVGLTTNYFVLEYQEKLANARSMEIKALVDYSIALAKLEQVIGTSLDTRNIKISQFH